MSQKPNTSQNPNITKTEHEQKTRTTFPQPDHISCNQKPEQTEHPFAYSELVKEHFLSPRNFLLGDESAWPADAIGVVGNPICGDQMKMFLRIDQETDTITDIRWKTYGCASAIASTSALSELAIGKTLEEAKHISASDIAEYLGGLPERKFHCSVLGNDALLAAIKNYEEPIKNYKEPSKN